MLKPRKHLAAAVTGLIAIATCIGAQDVQVFRELEPGLAYRHIQKPIGPLSIHLLRVTRGQGGWRWTTASGQDRVLSVGTVPAMAKAAAQQLKARPLAAINGDWFEIAAGKYQGDPRGLHIIEGEIVSAPTAYTSFWAGPDGHLDMGVVEAKFRAAWPDGKTVVPFGLNEARPEGRAVLYTPALGHHPNDAAPRDQTTRTSGGREFLLEPVDKNAWLPLRAGKAYHAKVVDIREGGSSPLGPRSVILSLGPKLVPSLPPTRIGESLTLHLETAPDVSSAQTAIAGGPRLVSAGKVAALDNLPKDRHPRSLLGWNKVHVFLAVVDGRQPKVSIGMSYPELANFAAEIGCLEAMALDGGGSSTLWGDGRVLNSPSDGPPRKVANALILVDGNPKANPPLAPRR